MQPVWCFQRVLNSRSPCSSVGVDIPSISLTSALRPGNICGSSQTTDEIRALAARSWSSNLISSWRWMTNPPLFHSRPWDVENLAPQPSLWVGRLGGVLQYGRCNQTWFRHGVGWLILLSTYTGCRYWQLTGKSYSKNFMNSMMSIPTVRATHPCIGGSCIPTSRMSQHPQWEDEAGLNLFYH